VPEKDGKFRSISLSEARYEQVRAARNEILVRGLSSIPKEVLERADVSLTDPFTLGDFVSVAVAALLHVSDEKNEKKVRSARAR
jgi:hypothetical protein